MSRFHTYLLSVVALLVCGALTAAAAEQWSYPSSNPELSSFKGSGTASSPYLIQSAQDLANLAYIVTDDNDDVTGKYFKMTRDIYLNDFTVDFAGTLTASGTLKEWTPIGEHGFFRDDDFEGIFDGNGHTIYGLYMKEEAKRAYVGLFGSTENAIVRNLTLKNVYVYTEKTEASHPMIGSLVGRATTSTFSNVGVEGCYMYCCFDTNKQNACYGGLLGEAQNDVTVTDCSFDGNIHLVTGSYVHTGGLVGRFYTSGLHSYTTLRLTGCHTSGLLMASYQGGVYVNMGGFLGKAESSTRVYITDCVNRLNLRADNETSKEMDYVYAYNFSPYATEVRRTANLGYITFTSNNIWYSKMGLTGECTGGYYDCVNYGSYTLPDRNNSKITIMPGDNKLTHKTSGENLIVWKEAEPPFALGSLDTYESNGTECTLAQLSEMTHLVGQLNDELGENVWGTYNIKDDYNVPMPVVCGGTSSSLYRNKDGWCQISSESDLRMLQQMIQGNVGTDDQYLLTADLDMAASAPLAQIGDDNHPFKGTFDGNGHVISGLTVDGRALFGNLSGTVKNLALVDMTFTGDNPLCAPLAYKAGASADATIANCYAGGTLTLADSSSTATTLAGLVYEAADNTVSIKNSYFKGVMVNTTSVSNQAHVYYGLVGSNKIGTSLTLADCYANFDFADRSATGAGLMPVGGNIAYGTNCHYLCPKFDDIAGRVLTNSELAACFAGRDGWLTGAYRPVLAAARHYALTAYDGQTVYADAIALDDDSCRNDIWCHQLTAETATDPYVRALPNVALCDTANGVNYLLNCQLYDSVPFRYTPPAGTVTKGEMHFPLTFSGDYAIRLMCLPATLLKSSLPDDCLLAVLGKAFAMADGSYSAYVVACDSVPAGVPFLVYMNKKPADTIHVVMRGYVADKPQTVAEQDGQQFEAGPVGTFEGTQAEEGCAAFDITGEGIVVKHAENIEVAPFGAYFDVDGDVACDGGVMLDEGSDYISDVIGLYKNRKVAIFLKRELHASGWNTLCLPFDMSADEIAGKYGYNTKVEQLSSVTSDGNGTLTLHFAAATGIEAGKCYLIMPANDERKWIQLDERTLYDEPGSTEVNSPDGLYTISLKGTFERKALVGTNRSKGTYFTQDNTIYKVAYGRTILMNGFRCWIETSVADPFSMAKIAHADGTTDNVRLVEAGTNADGNRIYDLQGIETESTVANRVYIQGGHKYISK